MSLSPNKDPFLIDGHKLQFHAARVAQWEEAQTIEDKLKVYPIYVEISPVGHCNHRCTFCAVDYIGYKTRRIDTSVLDAALYNMAACGIKSVMFAGEGEPMLHPDITRITNTAASAGLDVAFTTNGTALTQKFIDEALHAVKWIKVSVNGGPKSYAQIHQTNVRDYDRVWENILSAVKARNERGLSCAIGIQTVVLPENIADIHGLCERAKSSGVDYMVLKPYSQHKSSGNTTHKEVKYQDRAIKDAIEKASNYSTALFRVITRTQAMEDWDAGQHKYQTCHATPFLWGYVMASGDFYSCSAYLLNEDFKLGNIGEQSFNDIWLGDKRRKHIVDMESLDISKCRVNCRMNQVNKYLDEVKRGNAHENFI